MIKRVLILLLLLLLTGAMAACTGPSYPRELICASDGSVCCYRASDGNLYYVSPGEASPAG